MTDLWSPSRRDTLHLAAGSALLPLVGGGAAGVAAPKSVSSSQRDIPFNLGWRFFRGSGAFAPPNVDDNAWRQVDLPHDWSIEDIPNGVPPSQIGPFDKKAVGDTATGYTAGGESWYRKHFRVDQYPRDARVELLFDGVYLDSEIFLNGQTLGSNVHGYIPFAFDLSPYLSRDGDNVIAVKVRNEGRNTRWYAGSGIYRDVRLDVLPPACRLQRWGVAAWTRQYANGRAAIDVTTNIVEPDADLTLITRLVDERGSIVAKATSPASRQVRQSLSVRGPQLWSPEKPSLYNIETELRRGDEIVDRIEQPFGIRIVTFDPQRGMSINGEATKLRGGCVHHDNGLLGARAFADADERRIRLLKARGFNAIRSSHNPASRSLREACDRMGMLLIEEAFDVWHAHKEPQDFALNFTDNWHKVIEAMVLSARNSPSVIMWSIGNEIPDRASDAGVQWEWELANAVKRIDPTRPVTAGLNGVLGQEMIADADTARAGMAGRKDNASSIFIDVPGYNYRLEDIEPEQQVHPERVVYASETFARDVFDYAALMDRAPYFLGEFLWTAMDYIGEAGLGATAFLKKGTPYYFAKWPWVNAWCGDIDLIGHQKASSLARDVAWGLSPLEMTVQRPVPDGNYGWVANWGWPDELESWSWTGHEGKPLSVRIYTSGDKIQLLLNGKPAGEKLIAAADKRCAEFAVPYAPGKIEAIAWKSGRIISRRALQTTGQAKSLRCSVERLSGRAGRDALAFVQIEVVDAAGRVLPDDQRKIALTVDGPVELLAFGSANPQATGSLQSRETLCFRGRALAIVRGSGSRSVRIDAEAEGLVTGRAQLTMR